MESEQRSVVEFSPARWTDGTLRSVDLASKQRREIDFAYSAALTMG